MPAARLRVRSGTNRWAQRHLTSGTTISTGGSSNKPSHRPRLGYYTLRHVFLTIGEESRDQVAVAHVMGHVVPGMGTAYREKVSDERLRAVCEHVRGWLFGKAKPR